LQARAALQWGMRLSLAFIAFEIAQQQAHSKLQVAPVGVLRGSHRGRLADDA
jgi:hypothetical protein